MHLTQLAREHGGKPAVIMAGSGVRLSYAELERQSNQIAQLFRSRGLRPGDHIAVLMENRPEFFPVVWAAQRSGLFYTPVNWHLSAAEGYYMLYSSGTTGQPKGILPELTGQPFGTGLNIDHTMKNVFGFSPATVYLCPGPLYHGAPIGWSLGTIRNGGTVVVMERFDASLALALIARYRVTHGQFVPTMFVRMLKLSDAERAASDTSSLRLVVHAAAPVSVEVKERMIAWLGPVLTEFYAGSEGNGFCVIDSPTWLSHRGSVTGARSASRSSARRTSAPMKATSCRPARPAPSGSAERGASATTTIRRRRPARTTKRGGAPSGTWATSTPRDTCTSRTGVPT